MGMFDTLICELPLPDTSEEELESMAIACDDTSPDFQTKDLDCTLDIVYIKKDGYLYIMGGIEKLDYHGYIVFYTSGYNGTWFEYQAKFTDGKCVELKRIKNDPKV